MKLTPARFIAAYNALGVRFVIRGGIVTPVGDGVSPVFVEWVAAHSTWLKPGLPVQCQQASQRKNQPSSVQRAKSSTVEVESTPGDRLVWNGIVNARKAEARRAAIVRGRYK